MISSVRRSISSKFMLAVLATTAAALLVSGAAMLFYEVKTYQTSWLNDVTTQSNLLARVTAPALEFNDPRAAQEYLEQLSGRPNIVAGAIYKADGSLFARYSNGRPVPQTLPLLLEMTTSVVESDQVSIHKRITRNGELIGTVYVQAQYPLGKRVRQYSMILGGAMLASLMVAALVSAWLQSAVTKPIRALTEAVNEVIRRRDFSARVQKTTDDESGALVDAFNTMLAEVGERTKALEHSNQALQYEMKERREAEDALRHLNNTLEERIAARTAELDRINDQLRHSQKMEAIGQLTGGVAHDFNNVLQVISGNLQLLQMNMPADDAAQRRLETAAMAADRGAKLASQLLAFARRQPLQPAPINLGRVLRGMDELLRRALGESIEIETIVAGGLWVTLVDPYQIENVVLNLAINARDAMAGHGRLTLELGNAMLDDHYVAAAQDVPAGQYVMLAISDTGSGMTADVMARAFEPFFTTKPEGAGTGLGLSMAYGFVKQSSGHIRIYSELGTGTTIKIYFPRSLQSEVLLPSVPPGPTTGGTETILIVEDDPAVQATTVDMLGSLGYRVLRANDGQSALHILQSGIPIDLLFTDVVMPGPVRSPELATHAKRLFPGIEVLYTSGYTQNAIVHGGRLDPGVELISKPYRREDLARKIRHMLSSRMPVRAEPVRIAAMPPMAKPARPLRVLVVEDNLDAQQMLCELLKLIGHDAKGVSSAEDALPELDKGFDVLLTDVGLPGMSGTELARQAVARMPGIRIVFASGFGTVDTSDFGFSAASLPKPYNLERLQAILDLDTEDSQ